MAPRGDQFRLKPDRAAATEREWKAGGPRDEVQQEVSAGSSWAASDKPV
jgi:hypothetical protein